MKNGRETTPVSISILFANLWKDEMNMNRTCERGISPFIKHNIVKYASIDY